MQEVLAGSGGTCSRKGDAKHNRTAPNPQSNHAQRLHPSDGDDQSQCALTGAHDVPCSCNHPARNIMRGCCICRSKKCWAPSFPRIRMVLSIPTTSRWHNFGDGKTGSAGTGRPAPRNMRVANQLRPPLSRGRPCVLKFGCKDGDT